MMSSNDPELEAFVLSALKRQQNIQENLVPQVIERTGWNWTGAEEFIEKVRLEHNLAIVLWQGKFYTILSAIFLLAGSGITVASISVSLGINNISACLAGSAIAGGRGQFTDCTGLILDSIQNVDVFVSIGLSLILGGFIGLLLAQRQLRHGNMMVND